MTETPQRPRTGESNPQTMPALELGLVGIALLLCVAALHANWDFVHDDALIALRYTRSWLAGDGLVWNPGERVEGYTSFLMVVGTGMLAWLTGLDLVLAARVLNGVALIGTAWLIGCALRAVAMREGHATLGAAAACAVVLGSPALAIWVCGALEGPLYAFVCSAAVLAVLRAFEQPESIGRMGLGGFALSLPALTRPDGLFFLAVAGLFVLARARGRGVAAWRGVMAFCVAAGLPLLALFGFRLAYYGSLVPNTVLAKATGLPAALTSQGWSYVGSWFLEFPFIGLIALALLWRRWRRLNDFGSAFLAALILGQCAMIGFVGGDFMPAYRLLLPLVPISAIAIGVELGFVARGLPERTRLFVTLVVGVVVFIAAIPRIMAPIPPDPAAYAGTLIGRHVAQKWPVGTWVATNNAGALPYYAARYRFIDMLGLNDPVIARRVIDAPRSRWQQLPGHAKGDGAYVLERAPEIIILGPAEGTAVDSPWFLSDIELAENPDFLRRYTGRREQIDVSHVPYHQGYPSTRSGTLSFYYYERKP